MKIVAYVSHAAPRAATELARIHAMPLGPMLAANVAGRMADHGLTGNAFPFYHVTADGAREYGARMEFFNGTRAKVLAWLEDVSRDHGFTCAWIDAPGYSGCSKRWPDGSVTFPEDSRRTPPHGDVLARALARSVL